MTGLGELAGAARVAPFATSHEHAAVMIQLVTRRCVAALAAHRALGLVDDAADAVAGRIIARLPAGDAASLDAVLEARTAAARDVGIPLALPDAFEAWRLPAVDRAILHILIAARSSPVVARLLDCLGGATVAGVAAVLGAGSDGVVALADRLAAGGPLHRLAVLTVRDPDSAFLARRIACEPRLAALLGGLELDDALTGVRLQRARDPRVERWAPTAVREALRSAISDGAGLPVIELAATDAGPTIAADAALSLAWHALRVSRVGDARWLDALAREALLHHAVVIVEGEAPDALVQRFAALPIPVVVAAVRTTLPVRRIELPLPGALDREAHWRDALAGVDHEVELAGLARVVRTGPEAIARAAAHAALLARGRITRDDLLAALRAQLADAPTPITTSVRWDDLALPGEVMDRVRDFLAAVREQRLADGAYGDRATLAITGDAGTDKTPIAAALARELELPLVELTARTAPPALAAAITAAERGLVLLAADDDAYPQLASLRAPLLHLSQLAIAGAIALAAPTPEVRAKLWRLALGGVPQVADLGLDELAREHTLTGAQIRAIARRAAQIATTTGKPLQRPILRELARRTLGGNLA